ncbi:hypothetical protein AKJ41_02555 [candidate division MSBL1 archaeon SCGC-AAA259O05]|uniref:Glycosyltransferase RgtA/B/C/D-like domain-containing protein n=1 Tax=candidate division MSBL1 archaeon SCGC-AAA259O05 TaxID=1698271 RepID=A0A133V3Y6_9EURY|nr:hypothetical protein AKJ41_02555 [candidate division MSBL1 archaeon SCGC-AAA259O05]
MKKSHVLVLILAAAGIRLAPALWTGMPYSTDAWPLISNVEVLLEHSPVSLSSDLFGGYNNFWPGSQIFGTMLSELTSLSPRTSLAIGVPLSSSFAVVIFYAIAEKLTENTKIAFLSALLMAVAFPLVHFRASVTKETFSVALFMFLLLLYLKGGKKSLLLSVPVSVALVASHHFTSLIALTVLGVASALFVLKGFLGSGDVRAARFAVPAVLGSSFTVYYLSFAHEAAFFLPSLPHWVSAGGYLLVGLAAALYLSSGKRRSVTALIALLIGVYGVAVAATQVHLAQGAPVLTPDLLFYSSFLLLAPPAGVAGYWKLQENGNSVFSLAWIVSISAIILYALFGGSQGAFPVGGYVMAYRGLYFFVPPLCLFLGAGLMKIYRSERSLSKPLAVGLLGAFVVAGLSAYYVSLTESGRMLGYQALNTKGEFEASEWVSDRNLEGIAGDQKALYLLTLYRGENVNLRKGYEYLWGRTEKQPKVLYIHDQMYRHGYLLGLYGRKLPEKWGERTREMNLTYYNDYVKVFKRSSE